MRDNELKLGRTIGDLIEENSMEWNENEEVLESIRLQLENIIWIGRDFLIRLRL